jgi:parvulin-like peptidyl-prolyl isomerase
MKISVPRTLLLTVLLSAGAAVAQNAVIAKLGDDTITVNAVKPYLENLSEREREALREDPRLLNQVVRTLIFQQILLKEAIASGWNKRPEVEERIDRLRQTAIAESYLQEIAKVPDGYPSDAEIKEVFEARKAELIVPKQFHIAQIFLSAAEGGDLKSRLETVQGKLKQPGASFAAIAEKNSDDATSTSRGGEIGWVAESSLQPEIRKAISGLGKGGTTAPVLLADGYHIVRIVDVKEARPASLEEVRDQLARALREQRGRLNREAYLAKIQQQNPLALNELALEQLVAADKGQP